MGRKKQDPARPSSKPSQHDETFCPNSSEWADELFRRLKETIPHPKTELRYTTPFELLVAVVLSARTTDKSVNRVTQKLFKVANTPEGILKLGEEGLKAYLRPLGFYNQKAKRLIQLCRALLEQHGGEIPKERQALESLPGVGRKTANVVLNTLFGEETIAVDTHVFRVANRTGLAPGKTRTEVERKLLETVPAPFRRIAHHLLVLHGRYVCTARNPNCSHCVIFDLCAWPHRNPPGKTSRVGRSGI